jgi:hypothetical protein
MDASACRNFTLAGLRWGVVSSAMGILDLFKKKQQPPFNTKIVSFNVADGVGRLERDMKFGRSSCRDFQPAPGLTVTVTALAPHPLGGERATHLTLVSTQQEALEAVNAQLTAQGLEVQRVQTHADIVAEARWLASVILLMK